MGIEGLTDESREGYIMIHALTKTEREIGVNRQVFIQILAMYIMESMLV